jgi:hypothetical protein
MEPLRFREIRIATPQGDQPLFLREASAAAALPDPAAAGRDLLLAYLATHYEVGEPASFVLRVNQASPGLLGLYRALRVATAAYLTAWNPLSQPATPAANDAAQARLAAELRRRSLATLDGLGRDPSGQWPGERSLLVPGIALADAAALGRQFGQAAFLWAGADAVPRLYLLDLPP